MNDQEIYKKAVEFWATPSCIVQNDAGQKLKYTPSQIAMNNRRKAGLHCYTEGFKAGMGEVEELKSILKTILTLGLKECSTDIERQAILKMKERFNL